MGELKEKARRIGKNLLRNTLFDVHKQLPQITLEPFDLVLALLKANHEPKTVVQVGACDGVSNDPIHPLVKLGSAQCILIEPNPYAFHRLKKTYCGVPNVALVQAAVAKTDGEITLYRVREASSNSEAYPAIQIASFYEAHLIKHGVAAEDIEPIVVQCRSLRSLTEEFAIGTIDLLQIDTEGFDATVVRMALDLPALPNVINFEHAHLRIADRHPLYDQLAAKNYLVGHDSMNCTAIQHSYMDRLRGSFPLHHDIDDHPK